MNGWQKDKAWSDRFLHEIKGILGQHLISEPPIEEDRERNTDLVVLRLDAVRVGCRVRKQDQIRYADEFTIRVGRPSGIKTELTKIIEGWGDYFFYGFSDSEEKLLDRWLLGSLNAFRVWHSRQLVERKGKPPGFLKKNHDGSSSFCAYKWREIPGFVIAHNHNDRARMTDKEIELELFGDPLWLDNKVA
jgi:hypothetical protein